MAVAEPWEPDDRLPAAEPGVDLAGLRALARGRSQWRRQAAADPEPPLDDPAADPEPVRPRPRTLIEPLSSWC
jgi:hypothetical protein